jgi:hypothetical protein
MRARLSIAKDAHADGDVDVEKTLDGNRNDDFVDSAMVKKKSVSSTSYYSVSSTMTKNPWVLLVLGIVLGAFLSSLVRHKSVRGVHKHVKGAYTAHREASKEYWKRYRETYLGEVEKNYVSENESELLLESMVKEEENGPFKTFQRDGTEARVNNDKGTSDVSVPDIAIVVAYCNEPEETVATLGACENELRSIGLEVETIYYCKCSVQSFCRFHIPNIGREGQTFLLHILNTYHSLHPITMFVNGGFLSKPHAVEAVQKICQELKNSKLEQAENQNLSDFYIDQHKCHRVADSKDTPPVNCSSVEEYCSVEENRCNVHFLSLPCKGESQCGCSPQSNCTWRGWTKDNPVTQGGFLEPALNNEGGIHSFYTWACQRFNISPTKITQCGISWSSTFAVGRNRLQRLPLSTYALLVREFDLYGANGGIAVHYLERLWRSIYLC